MTTSYRTLSPAYATLYQHHLEAFQRRLARTFTEPRRYTDFYPSIGVQVGHDTDVLVYGQAVGGWHDELDYRTGIPHDRTEKSRLFSNKPYPGHSPLDWVNVLWSDRTLKARSQTEQEHYEGREKGYRAWSSFFWQTTVALMQHRLTITDKEDLDWHKGLVWSNLYKIAPQDHTEGRKDRCNPTETDRVLQRPEAVELVRMELEELRPKLCVALTNDTWWAPFRMGLDTRCVDKGIGGNVDRVEEYRNTGTRIVVVKRLRGMSYKKAVTDIIAASS